MSKTLTERGSTRLNLFKSRFGPHDPPLGDHKLHMKNSVSTCYGPILPKTQANTVKSTLGVIPAVFGSLPSIVDAFNLRQRIREVCSCRARSQNELEFNQLYVNHYPMDTRARIGFHHDHHITMGHFIAGISCGSTCELHLRAQDPGMKRPPTRVQLPPRSLYLMTGLSRWHLQHAIPVITGDRLSLTFRTVDQNSAPKQMWSREWNQLGSLEQENAHWPLLRPDGSSSIDCTRRVEKQVLAKT